MGADAELVLPSAPPDLYVTWADLWLAADEGTGPGDADRGGDTPSDHDLTNRFMTRVAVPSVRDQATQAQRAGAASVSPHLLAEPQMFALTLRYLEQMDSSLESPTKSPLPPGTVTLAQLRELHEQIRTNWAALVNALPLEQRTNQEWVFRSGYDAFQRGDLVAMHRWFAPDAILTVPGRTPYSGTYRGLSEILALLTLASDRLGIDSPELTALAADDDALLATFNTVIRRGDRSLFVQFRQRLWFNYEGQIVRSVLTFEDEDELNAFFDAT